MVDTPVKTIFALGDMSDLTTPTSARKYELGYEVVIEDSETKMIKKFVYVKSHGALTAYVPYVLGFTSTAAAEVKTAAPTTNTVSPGRRVCVPQVAFTSGYYGFVQIAGDCTAALANEAKAVGDYLQLLNGGVTLVVDGTSASTVLLGNSCAISKSATTGAGDRSIILLDKWSLIQAA
jgi:hypothetical protein